MENKIVVFGAGKIGRSFIGQLFHRGGYKVVFIDACKPIIDALNRVHKYRIIIKGEYEEVINIENVRGVCCTDMAAVVKELEEADLLSISVGQSGMENVARLIAYGLNKKFLHNDKRATDIIIAENMRNAAEYLCNQLKRHLFPGYPFEQLVGLVETSIGKMVPIMSQKDLEKDPLLLYAEPYNTLILDRNAFRNAIPVIEGLAPKDNMKAWVDRKLFLHNLGHAAAAYLGFVYAPDFDYIFEVLDVPAVYEQVKATMHQMMYVLVKKYSGEFTVKSLSEHVDDLLRRFRNKALGDTIYRVGCDMQRKLGPFDRLAGAIRLAMEQNMPYDKILTVLVCGCHFNKTDEKGSRLQSDAEFTLIYEKGIRNVMINICGFDENTDQMIISEAEKIEDYICLQLTHAST